MIAAQGGEIRVFDDPGGFHSPGATQVVEAWESGFVADLEQPPSAGRAALGAGRSGLVSRRSSRRN